MDDKLNLLLAIRPYGSSDIRWMSPHQPAGSVPQMAEEQGRVMHLVPIQGFLLSESLAEKLQKQTKTQIIVTKAAWRFKPLSVLDSATFVVIQ